MLKRLLQHRLFRNSSALFIVQLMNYAAPLLVLPYLSRILGVDGFGLVIAGTSLILFSNIISDFGFDLSATYLISRRKNSRQYISTILSSIYKLKLLLLIPVFIVLSIYLVFFENYSNLAMSSIFLAIFFQAYQAIWLFQGIEKMKLITYIMVSSKILYVCLIFIFVQRKTDYDVALLSYALSIIAATIISNILIYKEGFSLLSRTPKKLPKLLLKHSSQFFISRLATTSTASLSTILVHNFTSPFQTGLYGASERLLTAFRGITSPLNQAIYPYMAKTKNIKLLLRIMLILLVAILLPFIGTVYFASDILALIFGEDYRPATSILRIFLFTGFFALFTMLLGYPAFAAINQIKYANLSVIIGGSVQVFLLAIMIMFDQLTTINIAWSILLIEIIVLFLRSYWFCKYANISFKIT